MWERSPMPASLQGRKIRFMDEPQNPVFVSDLFLTRMGRRYRALCRIQKTEVLIRGGWVVPFSQFLADRHMADVIMQECRKPGSAKDALRRVGVAAERFGRQLGNSRLTSSEDK